MRETTLTNRITHITNQIQVHSIETTFSQQQQQQKQEAKKIKRKTISLEIIAYTSVINKYKANQIKSFVMCACVCVKRKEEK